MRRLSYIMLISLLLPLLGCKKILDVESTRAIGETNMWSSLEDARAALFGVYALNRAAMSDNNRHVIYGDVRLADFEPTSRLDLKAIHNNMLNADYKLLNDLSDWRPFYATINAANLYLERIHEVYEKDKRFVEQTYNLDRAQVKALRAFSYFYMCRIWGDVPLILSSHEGSFTNKPRDPQDKVFAAIEHDLLEAEPKLPYAYDGFDPEQTGAYYGQNIATYYGYGYLVSKQAVWAMLAHMYAWKGDYANAAIYAQKIVDKTVRPSGSGAALAGTFRNVNDGLTVNVRYIGYMWAANHPAVLFAVARGELATSGVIEELTAADPIVPNRKIPAIYVSKDSLFSIYNEGADARFTVDSVTKIVRSADGFFTGFDKPYPVFRKIFVPWSSFPNKQGINVPSDLGVFASPIVFSRFTEMGLLLAEAKAALNDKNGAIAILNQVRLNNSVPAYVSERDNGPLVDAIFKERRRELMGEGWRWYDYVRFKKIKNNDPKFNQLIQSGGIYWPVSRTLISQNPMLTQYPYWK
ncbi:RagB/SusD family nutrient uptake outer membrane protein [Pedobacter riviphilus]|uniref:RagB/SusD family nutrient uptake outer membrane protein n=1 Tax=Pedobacter riviphilus TaxID=2766984 RepID=A0ABX6TD97_9SPHI|nr:RagB/SusD family nutrient uptake outer membrane protein [Pedobacter riviphilus]QNR82885.1 RagB/SusD family nutrient uptake outer membrane protein [Pedobacter riviphilus]